MKHLCYYIDHSDSAAVHAALDEITERIPSWASYDSVSCEAKITCREEDAAFVERMLAPFV